jgi:hypothetical protein
VSGDFTHLLSTLQKEIYETAFYITKKVFRGVTKFSLGGARALSAMVYW